MKVLYLTEKIIAHFKGSTTAPIQLVAVKNSSQNDNMLPKVEIGDFISVSYDRKEKLYRGFCNNEEYSWTANDLAVNELAFQERFILADTEPLYALVNHIQENEYELYQTAFPGIRYVMMYVAKKSKYGAYKAIYQLPNSKAIHPFAEKLVEQMIIKEPEADEADIRYGDLNDLVEIDIDIAEYMIG